MKTELSVVSCQLSVASAAYRCLQRTTDHGPRTPRRALTLIELLVVIIILTTIVAAAIPIMTPADDDRRLREASRAVNTFISSAQSRAIAANRPVGIALKRLSQDTQRIEDRGVCVQLYYIEQLPPFTGFDENSAAMVAIDNGPSGGAGQMLIRFVTRGNLVQQNVDRLPTGWDPDPLPPNTVRPSDEVEVNGNRYRLTDDGVNFIDDNGFYKANAGNPVGTLVAIALNNTGQMINAHYNNGGFELATAGVANVPYWTNPSRYKILRQATPASDEPYQMPEGTAIDLRASGLGFFDYFYWPAVHDNNDPVMILFSPEGKVARLRFNKKWTEQPEADKIFDEPVVDDLYLMVGARQKAVLPLASDDPTLNLGKVTAATTPTQKEKLREPLNWLSGSSRWIVIGSQSGRIATVGNTFVDLLAVLNDPNPIFTASASTEEMRARQIVAARELTRQTTQATGR